MLQKFKITSCVFILCLFGLSLMTVSPVYAKNNEIKLRKCMATAKADTMN
jgi:hypothetical protein